MAKSSAFLLACMVVCGLAKADGPNRHLIGASTTDASADAPDWLKREQLVKRSRSVSIDPTVLAAVAHGALDRVQLKLFDDVEFTGTVERFDSRNAESFTCTGRVDGEPEGRFVLAAQGEAVVAAVWSPTRGVFELRPGSGGAHVVLELASGGPDECSCTPALTIAPPPGVPAAIDSGAMPRAPNPADASCAEMIDVLVLYTPLARETAGSRSAIEAIAYASVAATNIAYDNSIISARLRPVHVREIDYVESGTFTTDLLRLQTNGDSQLDQAHALRDQYGADLVCLLAGTVSGSCGVAYVMTPPVPSFQAFGFSVVRHICAVGNLSFAHELAHNLGCQHNNGDGTQGSFPYSFGHRFLGQSNTQWRTVMSGTPGVRVPHFSNPNILFDGVPTGVQTDQTNAAFNALSIGNTAMIVASFRSMTSDDCNANGQPDGCDIAEGASQDLNQNGIPDECDALPCAADPVITLVASDAASFDRFGTSAAMCDDRIVIGAEQDDDLGNNSGSAYVFRREGERWIFEAKLHAADGGPDDSFGRSIAISQDGRFILVGAFRDSPLMPDGGTAYVFHRPEGTNVWTQQDKLLPVQPGWGDWFGWSVGFVSDGTGEIFALVGALNDDTVEYDEGSVTVYRHNVGKWNVDAVLLANDAQPADRFGAAIGGSSSGRVIVGSRYDDGGGTDAGSAYVFRRAGNSWVQEGKLLAPDATRDDQFGCAVALVAGTALVGARGADHHGPESGAAYIYRLVEGAWSFDEELLTSDGDASDAFGGSVAVAGGFAVVGATLHADAGSSAGAAYVFRRGESTWAQAAKITRPDGSAYDNSGSAVTIAPAAGHAAAASVLDDHHGAVDAGSASVFPVDLNQPDCNGNGAPDACDIANRISADVDGDGVPDECQPSACPADVWGSDGVVDVNDLLSVVGALGPCPEPCAANTCPADITDDCIVGVQDLLEVIGHWGPCD